MRNQRGWTLIQNMISYLMLLMSGHLSQYCLTVCVVQQFVNLCNVPPWMNSFAVLSVVCSDYSERNLECGATCRPPRCTAGYFPATLSWRYFINEPGTHTSTVWNCVVSASWPESGFQLWSRPAGQIKLETGKSLTYNFHYNSMCTGLYINWFLFTF